MLEDWTAAVKAELGIDQEVDIALLLDLTKDVAHNVARPAAPLTALLVGLAAGRNGGSPQAVAEASEKCRQLALGWTPESPA